MLTFKRKMSFEQWEVFAEFAHSSLKRYFSQAGVNFETYCERLTNLVSEVAGEIRHNLLDQTLLGEDNGMYFEMISFKIESLYTNLFEKGNDGIRYLPDGFIISDDNTNEISSARILKQNVENLKRLLKKVAEETFVHRNLVPYLKKKRKRIPSRESFEIKKGKDVNLRAVYERLTDDDHPFIDRHETKFEDFERTFSGAPVAKKVNWIDVSALHYFIREIYGIGIERASEGFWVRASKCYTANGKDYSSRQLNDACDPSATVAAILGRAIEYFL